MQKLTLTDCERFLYLCLWLSLPLGGPLPETPQHGQRDPKRKQQQHQLSFSQLKRIKCFLNCLTEVLIFIEHRLNEPLQWGHSKYWNNSCCVACVIQM